MSRGQRQSDTHSRGHSEEESSRKRQGERETGRQKETSRRDKKIEMQSKARDGRSDRMDRVKSL